MIMKRHEQVVSLVPSLAQQVMDGTIKDGNPISLNS